MDALYWCGIAMLFRAPHNANPNECNMALVGVPHSSGNGTSERDQHLGPRAVGNVSANGRRVHMNFELDPWKSCVLMILVICHWHTWITMKYLFSTLLITTHRLIAAGTRPESVGGDHSVIGGILQALGGGNRSLLAVSLHVFYILMPTQTVLVIWNTSLVPKN